MSGLFTVVDLDDPEAIRTAASTMATRYSSVETTMGTIATHWSPLEISYDGAGAETVHTAMKTPQDLSVELTSAASSAKLALQTYADTLDELKTTRNTLLADIEDFNLNAGVRYEDDRGGKEEAIADLQARCQLLAEAKDDAQNACSTALAGIDAPDGSVRGSQLPLYLNAARETEGVEGYDPALNSWLSRFGVVPADALAPGLAWTLWGMSHAVTGISMAGTIQQHRLGRFAPRQNWLPRPLRGLAGRGQHARNLVSRTFGWDPRNVSHGGRYVKAAVPGSTVLGRMAARTNGTNYQAKPHQASRYARWGRVGRVAGPVGAVISGVGAGADQWSQDQQNHPEMRTAERVGRTATVGATVGGGALAGAAIGASLGSVVPGVGTVIGGIAGGIIGGVAGSELGKVVGDAIKEPIGKATQAVSDAVSEGASKIADGAGKVWDSVFG
ncbi:hypothetical protein F7P69_29950 [Cellulosimicrobium funkei]|nr:hypothetical protein [Cellulosimicrobium funkei]